MGIVNLQRALTNFISIKDARRLAPVLIEILKTGSITYDVATEIISEDAEDILTLGYGWRLILPLRAAKAGDWEDRMLIPQPGEIYEMPNVVKHLVQDADKNGNWNPEKAIIDVFRSIGEPASEKMPVLVGEMASGIKGHRVSGIQIKRICTELGLVDRIDPLVSELKACGILSHKLGALGDASKTGSPIYEINPSILVGGVEGEEDS